MGVDWNEADYELDSLAGKPDGPLVYVEQLGMSVPSYIDPRRDLLRHSISSSLMHHVPLKMRGPYKVLAGRNKGPRGERLDEMNYVLCTGFAIGTQKQCTQRAINRTSFCGFHGGALHPLDKSEPTKMSREARFKKGNLPVEEMTDEELARGQVRRDDGSWTNYKTIPAAVFQAAQAELFQRADIRLRENLVTAVDTVAEIAKGTAYEPEVRLRAATWMYERVRGRNPEIIVHTMDKPFEKLMNDVILVGGSREEARKQREIGNVLDAEVVEDEPVVDEALDMDYISPGLEAEEEEREQWAQEKVEAELPPPAESAEDFRKRMNEARAKRYASRNKGLDHVETFAYGWTCKESEDEYQPDPEDPEYEIPVWVITFTEPELPKVPKHVKAEDTRRIKRMGRR